jgi:hypothetical protein
VNDDLYDIDTGDEPGDVSAGPPTSGGRTGAWAPPASVTVHPGPGQNWHPPEGEWIDVPATDTFAPTRSQSPSDAAS